MTRWPLSSWTCSPSLYRSAPQGPSLEAFSELMGLNRGSLPPRPCPSLILYPERVSCWTKTKTLDSQFALDFMGNWGSSFSTPHSACCSAEDSHQCYRRPSAREFLEHIWNTAVENKFCIVTSLLAKLPSKWHSLLHFACEMCLLNEGNSRSDIFRLCDMFQLY